MTICTKWRTCDFGKIVGGNMVLNEYGFIVNDEWEQTFQIRKNVIRDVYVVMPNHFHAIIGISDNFKIDGNSVPDDGVAVINGNSVSDDGVAVINGNSVTNGDIADINGVETPCHGVSTVGSQHTVGSNQMGGTNEPGGSNRPKSETTPNRTAPTISPITHWKSGVLGAVIGQFKQQVTKRIRKTGFRRFHWQLRFHDHIIRDENELYRIRNYIKFNPANWNRDTFNANSNMVHEPETGYELAPWMI